MVDVINCYTRAPPKPLKLLLARLLTTNRDLPLALSLLPRLAGEHIEHQAPIGAHEAPIGLLIYMRGWLYAL